MNRIPLVFGLLAAIGASACRDGAFFQFQNAVRPVQRDVTLP